MSSDLFTIMLGFIEGFSLIISPCILPILPVFLAASINNSFRRSIGIILGFVVSFALFAYFSRQLVYSLGINLNLIRHFSYFLLFLFGLIMVSSWLTHKFTQITQYFAQSGFGLWSQFNRKQDFISGLFLGTLLALVWTPCAGPILATVIVQTVIQKTTLASFFVLLAFALGTVIPMLVIVLYAKRLTASFQFFKTKATLFRRILGFIIIASVALMIAQERGLTFTKPIKSDTIIATSLQQGLWKTYSAPNIERIAAWINSPPLKIRDLKGKVLLVDFWTYSCINCIRTIPYLNNWYQKYHHDGLVIIGVHTPEFDFEKDLANVKNAVIQHGIKYPVALDNQFVTWQNYANHYWPAHYLINKKGEVVYEHFGEGAYDVTENNIRFLLGIDETHLPTPLEIESYSLSLTPETYLGYERADKELSPPLNSQEIISYRFTPSLMNNAWDLKGAWQIFPDKIVCKESKAALRIHFNARTVYIVAGTSSKNPIKINILLDGVVQKSVVIERHSLYEVLQLKEIKSGVLELIALDPGLELYTITFGG